VGWTCADYDQHLQATRNNEILLNEYKAAAGTKTCPKCASLIEKVDGCDLIECSCCHAHLCWQCWTVDASIAEAYEHIVHDHEEDGPVERLVVGEKE
jgi:ribosomal protein L37AE/L43A